MEILRLLQSLVYSTGRLCLVAAIGGILAHNLYFRLGYHDTEGLGIITIHAAVYAGLATFCALDTGFKSGIRIASIAFSSYLVALFTSIIIYRLFFHRLRNFPGPFAAKITRFHGLYLARNGQLHIEQNKLFAKYGDIVRIAPNELLILRSDGIQKIHGVKSGCRKRNAGIYDFIHYQGAQNLDSILDREEHRPRRMIWERAFTAKAIATYEAKTRQVCHSWITKLKSLNCTPINSSLFAELITFDNMGKIGFSYDFNSIKAGVEHRMLQLLKCMFGQMGELGELVWPIAIMEGLGLRGDAPEFEEMTKVIADRRERSGNQDRTDILKHFLEDLHSPNPTAFFNRKIFYADAAVILVGATDTVAVAVSFALYHLANNPDHQTHLFSLVSPLFSKTIPQEFANADLAKLDFLEAFINETLRLDNPVSNNAARLTPPEGIIIDNDTYIPGGTAVRVPGYGMQRSKKAFIEPDRFIPERWTTRPDLILDRAAWFPFLAGPNNCVGKRLGQQVLRLVVAYTVYYFRVEFAPGEDGTAIYAQARNNMILKPGPCMLVFRERDRK
ncbi:Tryprostatin B 6-hydroxylase [Cladorrhinum sp. PSN332]|nr:Tryprostatin B 6-hydroxylase [Cladorrhinum sp. PSN332]